MDKTIIARGKIMDGLGRTTAVTRVVRNHDEDRWEIIVFATGVDPALAGPDVGAFNAWTLDGAHGLHVMILRGMAPPAGSFVEERESLDP